MQSKDELFCAAGNVSFVLSVPSIFSLAETRRELFVLQAFESLINTSSTGSPVLGTGVHLTALETRIIYASMGGTKQQEKVS